MDDRTDRRTNTSSCSVASPWDFRVTILNIKSIYRWARNVSKKDRDGIEWKLNCICWLKQVGNNAIFVRKKILKVEWTSREWNKLFEDRQKRWLKTQKDEKTRPETRPIPVADGWAGAEMRVFHFSTRAWRTDRPTDQPTDGRTKPLIESLVRD